MAGINALFSNNPLFNDFGVSTGTSSWTQFPSGTAKLLRFKANPANVGYFELEAFDAASGYDAPWPLAAGDDTGWIAAPISEGNRVQLAVPVTTPKSLNCGLSLN